MSVSRVTSDAIRLWVLGLGGQVKTLNFLLNFAPLGKMHMLIRIQMSCYLHYLDAALLSAHSARNYGIFKAKHADADILLARLLDIREDDNSNFSFRLIETKDLISPRPYVTLSHCWGRTRFIKPLVENLDDLKKRIPIDALPRTFYDAIQITRRLNIRYLWIDSLCIIQKSLND